MVVGQSVRSHTHITRLSDFTAPTEGVVSLVLRDPNGDEQIFTRDHVVRPGIYDVEVTPTRAGDFYLVFRIEVAGEREDVAGGRVRLAPTPAESALLSSPAPARAGEGEAISYLKEEQWTVDFATAWVRPGELYESLVGPGRLGPPAGGEVVLTAPVDAVVLATEAPGSWPWPGATVKNSQTLFRLAPQIANQTSLAELEARVRVLESELGVAEANHRRLEELLAVEAVSRRANDEAAAHRTEVEARLEAARRDLRSSRAVRRGEAAGGLLHLRAPFAGRLAAVEISPGQAVSAGQALARLVTTDPLWLEMALPPDQIPRLLAEVAVGSGSPGVELILAGGERQVFEPGIPRLVSVAPEIDPQTGTVAVWVEIPGDHPALRPGLAVDTALLLPTPRPGVVIPASAPVDDGGFSVVYVQRDGEAFVRRPIVVLARQGESLLVEGLVPGERLVTLGGGNVRRAALIGDGDIGHGHVH